MSQTLYSLADDLKILISLTYADDLTGLYGVGGDVYHLAVDDDVAVIDELTSCCT